MAAADRHPSLEELQQYCEGVLPDFRECVLDEHLADCEECALTIERMESLLSQALPPKIIPSRSRLRLTRRILSPRLSGRQGVVLQSFKLL